MIAMDSGRRIPVYITGLSEPVGTVISPVNSPGPNTEEIEVEGTKVTYFRRFEMQVYAVKLETFAEALAWPSFEPFSLPAP